jgi:hypothetical protein
MAGTHVQSFWHMDSPVAHIDVMQAPHAVPAPPSVGNTTDASHGVVFIAPASDAVPVSLPLPRLPSVSAAAASSLGLPVGAEELDELHASAKEAAVMLPAAQTHG